MKTDILTLLRKYQPYNKLNAQAADEIERLRTEITELQTRLRDTYKERDYWEWASRGE